MTAGETLTNTATLTGYAGQEGGTNFLPAPLADPATVTVRNPMAAKQLLGTEITAPGNNGPNQAAIGELVNYRLTVTFPQGITPGVSILDNLDPGLAFVGITNVSVSPNLTVATPPGTGTAPANVAVSNNGGTLTFSLGDVTDADTNDATAETLTIDYQAVVLNAAANQAPNTRRNSAQVLWAGHNIAAVQSPVVTIVEPTTTVAKTVAVNGVANGTGQAGDAVHYGMTLSNPTGSTAYQATFDDPLPAGLIEGAVGAGTPPSFTVADSAAR